MKRLESMFMEVTHVKEGNAIIERLFPKMMDAKSILSKLSLKNITANL